MTAVKNPNESSGSSPAIIAIVAIVAFFVVAFGAAKLLGKSDPVAIDSDGFEASAVVVEGTPLEFMPTDVSVSTDPTVDPAIGQTAPTISGQNFSGETVEIKDDGRAKAIYFVAHWCPHCQAEVPLLVSVIDEGLVPEGLDIYLVSTSVDKGRGNYPASAWLDGENWPMPIIRDDNQNQALINYGAGGFPYAVFLNSANQVVARAAGETNRETILQLWNGAVNAEAIPTNVDGANAESSTIDGGDNSATTVASDS
ncbi:MAG: TlpA disulfide reductase family protein [Acidimicrobiales bacterium]